MQKHKMRYKYKTTEWLEQHDRLHYSQHGKEKLQELKERNYRAIFRKREHRCWNNKGEDTCVNLYKAINENTAGNPVYVDENGKIYKCIYKESIPTNKKIVTDTNH